MMKRSLYLMMTMFLVIFSSESAHAAKKITFTWSTSFSLAYAPGSGLKPGVNPNKATINAWALEDCSKRYGFLYAEVLGESGRSLGKSNPKLTKKTASTLRAVWQKNGYGESEFLIETKCSGSMSIPVGSSSNSYSVKAYYQLWNENTKFKTKDGISSELSRPYSQAELNSNNWKVDLVAGQTVLNRCCLDNSWGPAPKFEKLPDLNFKLLETRDFNEEDQYQYGPEGKAFVFEIVNAQVISSSFRDWYIELNPDGTYHGEKDDEVYASLNTEIHQLTIIIPKETRNGPGQFVKIDTGYQFKGFARWAYNASYVYLFNAANASLTLKSKVEKLRSYPLN